MVQPDSLTRSDLSVLLRVVGSRNGADFDDILAFESSHHRQRPTTEQIRDSLSRLVDAELIMQRGNQYVGVPQVQAAFLDECRNCCDTIEEFDILNRIIAKFAKVTTSDEVSEPVRSSQAESSATRWKR
jgi:hypothetical protein